MLIKLVGDHFYAVKGSQQGSVLRQREKRRINCSSQQTTRYRRRRCSYVGHDYANSFMSKIGKTGYLTQICRSRPARSTLT